MIKNISIITIGCLCLMFGTGATSYAGQITSPALKQKDREKMQKHMEKMKQMNPQKYEAVLQGARKPVTGCRSCHDKSGNQETKK